jgi:hypothetical protein
MNGKVFSRCGKLILEYGVKYNSKAEELTTATATNRSIS